MGINYISSSICIVCWTARTTFTECLQIVISPREHWQVTKTPANHSDLPIEGGTWNPRNKVNVLRAAKHWCVNLSRFQTFEYHRIWLAISFIQWCIKTFAIFYNLYFLFNIQCTKLFLYLKDWTDFIKSQHDLSCPLATPRGTMPPTS